MFWFSLKPNKKEVMNELLTVHLEIFHSQLIVLLLVGEREEGQILLKRALTWKNETSLMQ
jgi:hypothetical protein